MLRIFYDLKSLDFQKLMDVYEESVRENGQEFFPEEEQSVQIRLSQNRIYTYLLESFFAVKGSFYAVWQEKDRYICALRIEPFQDGYLLSALETAPGFRRRGYGKQLIRETMECVNQDKQVKIYSHISNRNYASAACHRACGFRKVLDYAAYIDGTVSRNASTYLYEKVPD